jgi:ABC-2 type transport system permease protein
LVVGGWRKPTTDHQPPTTNHRPPTTIMITRIAQKEFTEMLRDGRFRWAAALVFTLLLTALALGWKHHREVKRQHDLAQAETREQWLKQPAKNPHSAAHYGSYAFKPKLLPALLDRGTDPYTGVAVWLEAHKQNEFKFRPAQDATAVQRFGELTAATVLQLLVPLLIILLSFAAFAGEREQGTLRQLLSLGVSKTALVWGKAAGIAGALGVLIVPAAVIGVIALALTAENGLLGASAGRLAWMFASYLLYFGIFIGVSLAVSAWAKSARFALVALLAFWIVNGLIAPRAVADAAKRIVTVNKPCGWQAAAGGWPLLTPSLTSLVATTTSLYASVVVPPPHRFVFPSAHSQSLCPSFGGGRNQ